MSALRHIVGALLLQPEEHASGLRVDALDVRLPLELRVGRDGVRARGLRSVATGFDSPPVTISLRIERVRP